MDGRLPRMLHLLLQLVLLEDVDDAEEKEQPFALFAARGNSTRELDDVLVHFREKIRVGKFACRTK